jgi:UPF0755 protein
MNTKKLLALFVLISVWLMIYGMILLKQIFSANTKSFEQEAYVYNLQIPNMKMSRKS